MFLFHSDDIWHIEPLQYESYRWNHDLTDVTARIKGLEGLFSITVMNLDRWWQVTEQRLVNWYHLSMCHIYIYIHTDQVSPQLSFCLFNRNLPRKWYRRVISSRSTMINEHPLRLVIWASLSQSVGLTNMGMESNAFIGDINERPVPKVSKGIQYGGRRVPTTSSNSMARSMAHIIDQDIPESCSRWCPPRWVSSIYPPVLILF